MRKVFLLSILFFWLPCFGITVLIDPGHGGRFDGCLSASGTQKEKDLVLQISKLLAQQLNKLGYRALLTRSTDQDFLNGAPLSDDEVYKDLEARQALIKTIKPDLFISLHLNSHSHQQTRGFELFVPYTDTLPAKSYQLASCIHYALAHSLDQNWVGTLGNSNSYDRGIRAARFMVLQQLPCPGVLIELDYLTNPQIEKHFNKNYCQILANALVKGIQEYININY